MHMSYECVCVCVCVCVFVCCDYCMNKCTVGRQQYIRFFPLLYISQSVQSKRQKYSYVYISDVCLCVCVCVCVCVSLVTQQLAKTHLQTSHHRNTPVKNSKRQTVQFVIRSAASPPSREDDGKGLDDCVYVSQLWHKIPILTIQK